MISAASVWTRPAFFMFLVYLTYLALGGLLFSWAESTSHTHNANSSHLVHRMVAVLQKEYNKSEIIRAFNNQVALRKKARTEAKDWKTTFGEKFIFSMIVITTIGYGNVVPGSSLSRLACMAYGFVGFPLNLTLMRLLSLKFRCGLRQVLERSRRVRDTKLLLPFAGFLFFALFCVAFIAVPAATVFPALERWTYEEGIYYGFVSLSTVGFGDYVAGYSSWYYPSAYYPVYMVAICTWLLLGAAFVATALGLLSYLLGLKVMDKVDCRCHKRKEASREVSDIYECAAELTWQLTKYTPQKFTLSQKVEEFRDLCLESPEALTTEDLMAMVAVADDLREKTYDEMRVLFIPERFASRAPSATPQDVNGKLAADQPSRSNSLKKSESCPSVAPNRWLGNRTRRVRPSLLTTEVLDLAK